MFFLRSFLFPIEFFQLEIACFRSIWFCFLSWSMVMLFNFVFWLCFETELLYFLKILRNLYIYFRYLNLVFCFRFILFRNGKICFRFLEIEKYRCIGNFHRRKTSIRGRNSSVRERKRSVRGWKKFIRDRKISVRLWKSSIRRRKISKRKRKTFIRRRKNFIKDRKESMKRRRRIVRDRKDVRIDCRLIE